MAEDKVYTPEVVQDAPFPGQDEEVFSQPQSSGEVHSPTTTKDVPIRRKRISHELISQALNTRSKKILQEFELTQSGAIKIGNYKEGIDGDLRLTPNGLTARDKAGVTTFAIDGLTGGAVFKGTVQAGSVIATEIDGEYITAGSITADKISATYLEVGDADGDLQTSGIDGAINVGSSKVKIDGANTRIIINDGTNDRILIGYQSGGF